MREIKFRGWHTGLKQMYYNCSVNSESWLNESHHYGGSNETVMQYTGLKDKNGKEIYESDIVGGSDGESEYMTGVIVFEVDHSGWFVDVNKDFSIPLGMFFAEVIGNIFENPNLLTPTVSPIKEG